MYITRVLKMTKKTSIIPLLNPNFYTWFLNLKINDPPSSSLIILIELMNS